MNTVIRVATALTLAVGLAVLGAATANADDLNVNCDIEDVVLDDADCTVEADLGTNITISNFGTLDLITDLRVTINPPGASPF